MSSDPPSAQEYRPPVNRVGKPTIFGDFRPSPGNSRQPSSSSGSTWDTNAPSLDTNPTSDDLEWEGRSHKSDRRRSKRTPVLQSPVSESLTYTPQSARPSSRSPVLKSTDPISPISISPAPVTTPSSKRTRPSAANTYDNLRQQPRLVIAIDYGTTYTGVAYATPAGVNARIGDVNVVDYWGPKPGMSNDVKVPSVISYSQCTSQGEQQWATDLTSDAVVMVNTKLELDVQDDKLDELELILGALDGMRDLDFRFVKSARGLPSYTWKSPEDIATDYLTKVFTCIEHEIFEHNTKGLGAELKSTIAVDIVLTVPVKWSYRAKNSTLRAVRKAGFNEATFPKLRNIIMVTEPEAAAIYTARYLSHIFQEERECFILCDAGGGTVDVVSYKVTQLDPTFDFERITLPTGAKCGSSFINAEFKQWLRDLLGDNYYDLDPTSTGQKISAHTVEGNKLRVVMKQFEDFKRGFSGDGRDMKLDLPAPLDKLTIGDNVIEGEVRITSEDMASFFSDCVDDIIELIESQLHQIEKLRLGRRVKNLFLIGGFGESKYLQHELERSLQLRKVQLRRPDTSWSAVSRGAAIYGIEKSLHKKVTVMTPCPRSYGINLHQKYSGRIHSPEDIHLDPFTNVEMAGGQLTWLILKDDLLLSDAPKRNEKEFAFQFREGDPMTVALPIYSYEQDDIPDRFETAHEEIKEATILRCDLSRIPLGDFDRQLTPGTGMPYYSTFLTCRMEVSGGTLKVEVLRDATQLCVTQIKDIHRADSKSKNPYRRAAS